MFFFTYDDYESGHNNEEVNDNELKLREGKHNNTQKSR